MSGIQWRRLGLPGDLRVHPGEPVVLLADVEGWGGSSWDEPWRDFDGPAAFVVSTVAGPVLSFMGETYDLPAGPPRAAVLNRGYDLYRCFVLLDDTLHVGVIEE